MRSGEEFRLSPLTILSHAEALDRLQDVEKCTMFNTLRFAKENQSLLAGKLLFINSIPACTLPDADFEQLYQLYGDIMQNIVVEFTEQTEASSSQLKTLLERSQRCGFKVAIDDYGTGYSNISNLLTFMPNVVKIDRSLIMNIHKDKRKKHFTRNIIDYAHDNNFMGSRQRAWNSPRSFRPLSAWASTLSRATIPRSPLPGYRSGDKSGHRGGDTGIQPPVREPPHPQDLLHRRRARDIPHGA